MLVTPKIQKVRPEVALTKDCSSCERENMLVKPKNTRSATARLHLPAELNDGNPGAKFRSQVKLRKIGKRLECEIF